MALLETQLEALLFLSTKPLSPAQISRTLEISETEASAALLSLAEKRNTEESGVHLVHTGDEWQMATNPACANLGEKFVKEDADELTRPSLEALTIIAYRGPITKPEIEAIRGVNCTLILRNLLMRGLVTERENALKGQMVYELSLDAVRFLGVHDVRELPSYDDLHGNTKIDILLRALTEKQDSV